MVGDGEVWLMNEYYPYVDVELEDLLEDLVTVELEDLLEGGEGRGRRGWREERVDGGEGGGGEGRGRRVSSCFLHSFCFLPGFILGFL